MTVRGVSALNIRLVEHAHDAGSVARVVEQVYGSPLPQSPMDVLLRQEIPALCWAWQREPGDQGPKTTVIAGRHLPLPASALNTGIRQIGGDATVHISGGQFIGLQSPDPRYGESLYYVDPQGVRYGIPNAETASKLGLTSPRTEPWQVVSRLIDGPVLSQEAALVEHDTLPADPNPRKVSSGVTVNTNVDQPVPVAGNGGGG